MNKLIELAVVALFVMGMCPGAIIDDFTVGQSLISDSTANGTAVTAGPTAIGGGVMRTVGTSLLSGATSTSMEVVGGFKFGNTGADALGWSGAWYDGSWDLSASGQSLAIDLISRDQDDGYVVFWVSDGVGTLSATVAAPGSGSAFLAATLGSFSGSATDLSAITQVGFAWYNTIVAQDVQLDNFQTYVPEPGTYALMAAGLIGLFAIRKKKA